MQENTRRDSAQKKAEATPCASAKEPVQRGEGVTDGRISSSQQPERPAG